MLISKAAAKLILAGEHGVLYGVSAITTSIHWYTYCEWQITHVPCVLLGDRRYAYTQQSLAAHWQVLSQRHSQWKAQPNTQILNSEQDLPLLVLAWWQRQYGLAPLQCRIRSDIPIGCGLGSSASVIIALLRGLAECHRVSLSMQAYQQIATELEHFAHGRSSGLDVKAILMGACTYWHSGEASVLAAYPMGYLVNTGQPDSSTAACVQWIAQQHGHDRLLWEQMERQVKALAFALDQHNDAATSVRQLQALLTHLGVVPQPVQAFTAAIEALGWAGKLCGAGSISGYGGGFYWLLTEADPTAICAQFNYSFWNLDDVSEKTVS